MNEEKTPILATPIWYALAALLLAPACALMFVFVGILTLACWPVMPFVMYKHRRDELQKAKQ